MGVVTGGGGGGGPAAGSYIPVANKTGATVDTTTYNDPVAGGGAKLTTLVSPSDQSVVALAVAGEAFPRWLWVEDGLFLGDGTFDAYANGASIFTFGGELSLGTRSGQKVAVVRGLTLGDPAAAGDDAPKLKQLSPKFTITSGALSTFQLVSGTGAQILTARDAETVTPCTFNPGAATTATVTVALSPDDTTYSTLAVVTEPAGVALDGTILPVKVRVPAGWYLKLTANAQAVLGLTTYY
jgi:hypothetical protein